MSRSFWGQNFLGLSVREVINRAVFLYESRDLAAFSKLVADYETLIKGAYDDFFTIGIQLPQCEAFLLRLVQLDKQKNDKHIAGVHARCLRDLHTLQLDAALAVARVLCTYYGREHMQPFLLNIHLTFESGYDPTFRPNMRNILLTTMRRSENEALTLLRIFLQDGVNVNARYKEDAGQSAFHFAVSKGFWECASLLLEHGANPDMSFEGTTARQIISQANTEFLTKLTRSMAPTASSKLTDALFAAIRSRDETTFVQLLKKAHRHSPPDDYADDDGWCTLLQAAAMRGLSKAVEALLDRGMCAHDTCVLQDPPLLLAAELGHLEVVLQLVRYRLDEAGYSQFGSANVLVTGDHGDTVLHFAARSAKHHTDAVPNLMHLIQILTRRGELNLYATNKQGESAFSLLTELGDANLFQLILMNGAFLGMDRQTVQKIQSRDLQCAFDNAITTVTTSRAFVLSVTIHVAALPQLEPVSRVFTLIFWTYVMAREAVQTVMAPLEYLRHIENWLHVVIIIVTPIMLLSGTPTILGVLLVMMVYAEFSLLLGRHPSIARYVAMFLKVYKTNILLLAISAPFLFSFAVSFSVLFYHEGGLFNTTLSSTFKTIIMATGEFGLEDIDFSFYPYFSQFIFLSFVVSIEIILMNLLHALAVHDTEGIERDSQRIAIRAKIQLYTRIEAAWLGYPMDWYTGPWGSHVLRFKPWLQVSAKLKSLVRISVLPLSQEQNCRINITEDGHLINEDNNFDLFSRHHFVRILVQLVTGVHLCKMYNACYEYQTLTQNSDTTEVIQSLIQQIQALRQEIQEMRTVNKSIASSIMQHIPVREN